MAKVNFWTDNQNANLLKLKKLIQLNPNMSNAEIATFFNKSISAIQAIKLRNGIKHQRNIEIKKKVEILQTNINDNEYTPIDWCVRPTQIGKLGVKKFKTYIIVADTHIPHENVAAIKSVLKLMDDVKFDGFIILGDYLSFDPISHWLHDKGQNRTLENKRMRADYIEGNRLLDEFDKRLPKGCDKRFFYGNHERFYQDLIEKMPALEGMLCPQTELKLKERGYIVYPVNHIERIGKLNLCHGQYHNQNYVLKHIMEFKANVLHADMHSPRMRFENSPAKELAIAGYCTGCLCDTNPIYGKGRANKWSHGFSILYTFEDGNFDVDLKRIVQGGFIYNQKLYNGNEE